MGKFTTKNRILYISNIGDKRMTGSFSVTAIAAAHDLGKEFIYVANRSKATEFDTKLDEEKWGVKLLHIDLSRNPFNFQQNYKAYKQLIKIIKDYEIEYIHCNTPVGGLLGRLAGKKCKVKKVIYQAHGFHFYKGAPIKNWIVYYPIEKWLAHYTDALITINSEDFELAKKKMKLRKNGKIYYAHGVGIDTKQYKMIEKDRDEKRVELGLDEDDIALISMGDLIECNNYDSAICAVAKADNPALQYFICGKGPGEEKLKALAESLNISKQIHFLGYRSDIKILLKAADIFFFTTLQDDLPSPMIKAMASGLSCVASKIRGNTDLLYDTGGGFLCEAMDIVDYAKKLNLLAKDKTLRETMGRNNLLKIQKFSTKTLEKEIGKIYAEELLGEDITINEYMYSLIDYFPSWARTRMTLGVPLDAFLLISVGELNDNKNNGVIISAMERLRKKNIYYILCGEGERKTALKEQADKAGLHDNVHFLGFRNDVKELYEAADCFVMPSKREGLSRSIMEAMASGLPCIVSRIRGNTDLILDEKGGFLCDPHNVNSFSKAITSLYDDYLLCKKMGIFNKKRIKEFDASVVREEIKHIYKEVSEN